MNVDNLEHTLLQINDHDDYVEDLNCNNKRTQKRKRTQAGGQIQHVTSMHMQTILHKKIKLRKCTCTGNCQINKFIKNVTYHDNICECIENPNIDELINRSIKEKKLQKEGKLEWNIPCTVEKIYIYSPHANAYIIFNDMSVVHLNRGLNSICICNLNQIRGKCGNGNNINSCEILTLGAGLFLRLIRIRMTNYKIAMFCVYNNFHTCNQAPDGQSSVPSLSQLAQVGIIKQEIYTLSKSFIEYAVKNLPKDVCENFPSYTQITTVVPINSLDISENVNEVMLLVRLCSNSEHRFDRTM
jgi:hypothetical protein